MYTGPANSVNDENSIMLGNLKPAAQAAVLGQKRLAGYALDEIERIIDSYGEEIV